VSSEVQDGSHEGGVGPSDSLVVEKKLFRNFIIGVSRSKGHSVRQCVRRALRAPQLHHSSKS
jgi:hypothetical protein